MKQLPHLNYYSESGEEIFYGHDGDAGLDLPLWDARLTKEYFEKHVEGYNEKQLKELEQKLVQDKELMKQTTITLKPKEALTIKTGVYMKIPEGNYGFLDTRSSTSKIRLDLLCRTIDEPFTGNIRLALINLNTEPVTLTMGQCVAQIIIKPYTKVDPIQSPSLEDFLATVGETSRGDNGFGSTGRNV